MPLGILLAISFGTTDDLGNSLYGWHPENYERGLRPAVRCRCCCARSGYAVATVVLCLLIGYPVAYYIARFGGRRKNLLIALVVLPFFVNYLVRTYAWVAILGDEGVFNGAADTDIRFLNTPYAVIGGLVYGYLAFMILPIYAALDRMDPALIEAGKDLYGWRWQTFRHVTFPHTFQGVLAGARARLPAGGGRLRQRPAARRPGRVHGRQPDPAAVLRRRELALRRRADHVMMAFLLIFMSCYLRSAARAARGDA